MAWTDATKTNAGEAMLGRMIPGMTPHWGVAVGGTGTVPPPTLEEQTELANQKQEFQIVASTDVPNGKKLLIQITNIGVSTSYAMQQVGIMAYLDDEPPILFAILQDNAGVVIPSAQEMPEFVINFYVVVNFSNKVNFQLTIDPTVFVTFGAMAAVIEAAVSLKQDNITAVGLLKGNGNGSVDAALLGVDYGLPQLSAPGNPTESTPGAIGQQYVNTDTQAVFVCRSAVDDVYTWRPAGSGNAEDIEYGGQKLSEALDEIIQSASNMEYYDSAMSAALAQEIYQHQRALKDLGVDIIARTLVNSQTFPFNDSTQTVTLSKARNTMDYRVHAEAVSSSGGPVGDIVVSDKALNGFKIAYTGSAASATLKLYVAGGFA